MIRCTRCLYPDTKPDLHFDAEGVCSACRAYDKRKEIDWAAREQDLLRILNEAPRGEFDCVVPSSGGKDSHWQVLKLLELGVRPLIVTATTCHLTPIGRRNIDNLARYATTLEVTPNREIRAKLNRLGLQLVGDISWPEHASIFSLPFKVAVEKRIPLIFYGECPQEAYGGPPGTDEAREMTYRWVHEFGGFNGLRPADFVGMEGITERDMRDYTPPGAEAVAAAGVRAYFLGQFYEWDSHRNAEAARAAGMACELPTIRNWWLHENLDNAQTGIHDRFMQLKYGYGRACAQLSVDVRSGRISREDALDLLWCEDLLLGRYADIPLEEILAHIGLTLDEYHEIEERFRA